MVLVLLSASSLIRPCCPPFRPFVKKTLNIGAAADNSSGCDWIATSPGARFAEAGLWATAAAEVVRGV